MEAEELRKPMIEKEKALQEALKKCTWYIQDHIDYDHYIDACDECSRLVAIHFFEAGVSWGQQQKI
jgi:hypothetical protein